MEVCVMYLFVLPFASSRLLATCSLRYTRASEGEQARRSRQQDGVRLWFERVWPRDQTLESPASQSASSQQVWQRETTTFFGVNPRRPLSPGSLALATRTRCSYESLRRTLSSNNSLPHPPTP